MKVLVTGGLGNLGSWITGHLLESGFEVTTFSSTDRDVLRGQDFERIFGDIENDKNLERLFSHNSWDVIIHLASINESSLPDYPTKALAVNTFGTRKLLQKLTDTGRAGSHVIYFSTFHVYGASSGIVEEDTVLPYPKNDYAATHLFAEYYVRQFHASHRVPFTILRLTNSYGAPREIGSSKWHLILNDLARMAIEQNVIKLTSNGRSRRDFIWMGDVCRVVEKCIRKGAANEVFNLGSGISSSSFEVAEAVRNAFERLYGRYIDIQRNEKDLAEYDDTLRVSIEKLKNWIDFTPQNRMQEEAAAVFQLLENSTT